MAKLDVSIDVPLPPDEVWAKASDLALFDQWLTIHDGWRSELPDDLTPGTVLESVVSVKGMRNRVRWTLDKVDPPRLLTLAGSGKGGTKFTLKVSIAPQGDGSRLSIAIELGGAPLFGPIGSSVAKALRGDIENSLAKFLALVS